MRGLGRIIEIDRESAHSKAYRVQFDNGEVHSYSAASAAKLRVVPLSEVDITSHLRVANDRETEGLNFAIETHARQERVGIAANSGWDPGVAEVMKEAMHAFVQSGEDQERTRRVDDLLVDIRAKLRQLHKDRSALSPSYNHESAPTPSALLANAVTPQSLPELTAFVSRMAAAMPDVAPLLAEISRAADLQGSSQSHKLDEIVEPLAGSIRPSRRGSIEARLEELNVRKEMLTRRKSLILWEKGTHGAAQIASAQRTEGRLRGIQKDSDSRARATTEERGASDAPGVSERCYVPPVMQKLSWSRRSRSSPHFGVLEQSPAPERLAAAMPVERSLRSIGAKVGRTTRGEMLP
jgi:hypothetical protein